MTEKLNLTPATKQEIELVWTDMVAQFKPEQQTEILETKARGYVLACQGRPYWAIRATADEFLTGKIERKNNSLLPYGYDFGSRLKDVFLRETRKHIFQNQLGEKVKIKPHKPKYEKPDPYADRLTLVEGISHADYREMLALPCGAIWTARRGVIAPEGWGEEEVNKWKEKFSVSALTETTE